MKIKKYTVRAKLDCFPEAQFSKIKFIVMWKNVENQLEFIVELENDAIYCTGMRVENTGEKNTDIFMGK